MSTPKRYYWMKLKESFMTSDTIDYFMSQPDGANYVVLYQMLCLKTINTDGRLSRQIGEIIIPYDVEKIRRDMKWFSADTIRVALKLYQAVGLIYEDVDGSLVLTDHSNLVGSESDSAKRMRIHRSKERQELPEASQCDAQCAENVTPEIDIDIRDRYKEIDIRDKESKREPADESPAPPRKSIDYESIKSLYNATCVSFPRCTSLSDDRRKAIKARFTSGYSEQDFQTLFSKAEASSFLRGKNNRNWTASFDWLIKDANMAKVLDGNYDDHGTASSGRKDDLDFIPN